MVFSKILVNGVPVTRAGEDKGKISKVSYDGLEGFFGKKSEIVKSDAGGKIALENTLSERFPYLRITGNAVQNGTPSPDNPVEIDMASGVDGLPVRIGTRNLIREMLTQKPLVYTHGGVTFSYDEKENLVTLNGVSTQSVINFPKDVATPIDIVPNSIYECKNYEMSGERYYPEGKFSLFGFYDKDDNGFWFRLDDSIKGRTEKTKVSPIVAFYFSSNPDVVYTNYKFKLYLEEVGTRKVLIIPKEVTLSDGTIIPLNFAKVNDVTDELKIENGKVVYIQRLKEIVFDGTEAWNFYEQVSNAYCYWLKTPSITPNVYNFSLCNFYKNSSYIFSRGEIGQYCDHPEYQRKYFYTSFATIEEWKLHLADLYEKGTPLKVLDTLATPIETDITDTDVGRALLAFAPPKGATTFEVLSKILPSEIELSYWQEM